MGLKLNPVGWFEIPVLEMERAKTFYESAFGIEITVMEMRGNLMGFFPMEMGPMGASGTIIQGEEYKPSKEGTLVYFQVDAIDESLEAIKQAGGKELLPRTSIDQHGFIARFEDTEGNIVALHEAVQG